MGSAVSLPSGPRSWKGPCWSIMADLWGTRYLRLCPALFPGSDAQGRASPIAAGGGSCQFKVPKSKVLPSFLGRVVHGPQRTPVSLGHSPQSQHLFLRPTSRLWAGSWPVKAAPPSLARLVSPAFPYQTQLGEPEAGGCGSHGEKPGL